MGASSTVIRSVADAYQVWDQRSVIVKEQSLGSTIVYPRLPAGVSYRGFNLREEYVVAGLHSLEQAVMWCRHNYYDYSILGQAPPSFRDNKSRS